MNWRQTIVVIEDGVVGKAANFIWFRRPPAPGPPAPGPPDPERTVIPRVRMNLLSQLSLSATGRQHLYRIDICGGCVRGVVRAFFNLLRGSKVERSVADSPSLSSTALSL